MVYCMGENEGNDCVEWAIHTCVFVFFRKLLLAFHLLFVVCAFMSARTNHIQNAVRQNEMNIAKNRIRARVYQYHGIVLCNKQWNQEKHNNKKETGKFNKNPFAVCVLMNMCWAGTQSRCRFSTFCYHTLSLPCWELDVSIMVYVCQKEDNSMISISMCQAAGGKESGTVLGHSFSIFKQ